MREALIGADFVVDPTGVEPATSAIRARPISSRGVIVNDEPCDFRRFSSGEGVPFHSVLLTVSCRRLAGVSRG